MHAHTQVPRLAYDLLAGSSILLELESGSGAGPGTSSHSSISHSSQAPILVPLKSLYTGSLAELPKLLLVDMLCEHAWQVIAILMGASAKHMDASNYQGRAGGAL